MRLRLTLILPAALFALGAAAPAHAASRLIVHGAGYGHGVGMSQYGAYGYAKRGTGYRAILGHYYTDTRVSQLDASSEVRVLVQSAARVAFSGATSVAGGRRLSSGTTYRVTRSSPGRVTLRSPSGRALASYAAPLRVVGSSRGIRLAGRSANAVSDGAYRGALEIRPGGLGELLAVNAVGLEDYVRGVVSGESPSSWPAEALKAQAVAARTYAITTSKAGNGFQQYSDTRSQVYNGVAGETATTDAAVAATRGEVVTYRGAPVVTYFFSTSGGETENVENSFIGADPKPWLKGVKDPYDGDSPKHRWTIRMSLSQAQAKLGSLVKGRLRSIRVRQRGVSPRVVSADVVGSRGRTRVTGPTLRSRLGLYDTWASFTVIGSRARPPAKGEPVVTPDPGSGTDQGGAQASAAAVRTPRGVVTGRVAPADDSRGVQLQRRGVRRWQTVLEPPVSRSGRYRAAVTRPGAYRVRFRKRYGPVVRVR